MTFIRPFRTATSVPGFWRSQSVGILDEVDLPGIDHDQFGAVLADGPFDAGRDDGMVFRRVGSRRQDDIGEFDLLDGVRHCTASECGGQTGHRHGVSETGAVIDIVGADHRAHEFLEEVVFLIGAAGRGETGDAVRPVTSS